MSFQSIKDCSVIHAVCLSAGAKRFWREEEIKINDTAISIRYADVLVKRKRNSRI